MAIRSIVFLIIATISLLSVRCKAGFIPPGRKSENDIWFNECSPEECPWDYPPFNREYKDDNWLSTSFNHDSFDGYPGTSLDFENRDIGMDNRPSTASSHQKIKFLDNTYENNADSICRSESTEQLKTECFQKIMNSWNLKAESLSTLIKFIPQLPHSLTPRRPDFYLIRPQYARKSPPSASLRVNLLKTRSKAANNMIRGRQIPHSGIQPY